MWETEFAEMGSPKEKELQETGWEPFGVYAMQQAQQAKAVLSGQSVVTIQYKPVIIYRRYVETDKCTGDKDTCPLDPVEGHP